VVILMLRRGNSLKTDEKKPETAVVITVDQWQGMSQVTKFSKVRAYPIGEQIFTLEGEKGGVTYALGRAGERSRLKVTLLFKRAVELGVEVDLDFEDWSTHGK